MYRATLRPTAAALGLLLVGTAAAEQPTQSIETIADVAARFATAVAAPLTQGVPQARAGRLDPRLRLPRCDAPLEAFRTRGGRELGNVTVGVRCAGPRAWTVYVPVNVVVPGDVLVASRYLPRGTLLRAGDLRVEQRDLGRLLNGYLSDPGEAVGKRLKQPLNNGAVLAPGNVTAPRLVRRGSRVTILVRRPGLEIRAAGKALHDGAQGDIVQVRNSRTRRVVEGVVTGEGLVAVDL